MTTRNSKPCAVKTCRRPFYPFKTTERVCSVDCAIAFVQQKKKEEYDKETRRMKRERNLKDRGYQTKRVVEACNAYIRERDAGQPCISCGKNSGAKMNAGHYLTAGGHPELRFEEDNIHLQCEWCNSYLSGNIARYRINLIKKIGLERVEWLEGPHEPANRTIDDLIETRDRFKLKLKSLQQERAA